MIMPSESKDYELIREGGKYSTRCKHCHHKEEFKLPKDHKLHSLMKIAGGNEWNVLDAYLGHEKEDSSFCGWSLQNCDLCGQKRVIGFAWQYYSTGPDFITVWPSRTLNVPGDGQSGAEVNICSFCLEKSLTDPRWYFNSVGDAIKDIGKRRVKNGAKKGE